MIEIGERRNGSRLGLRLLITVLDSCCPTQPAAHRLYPAGSLLIVRNTWGTGRAERAAIRLGSRRPHLAAAPYTRGTGRLCKDGRPTARTDNSRTGTETTLRRTATLPAGHTFWNWERLRIEWISWVIEIRNWSIDYWLKPIWNICWQSILLHYSLPQSVIDLLPVLVLFQVRVFLRQVRVDLFPRKVRMGQFAPHPLLGDQRWHQLPCGRRCLQITIVRQPQYDLADTFLGQVMQLGTRFGARATNSDTIRNPFDTVDRLHVSLPQVLAAQRLAPALFLLQVNQFLRWKRPGRLF